MREMEREVRRLEEAPDPNRPLFPLDEHWQPAIETIRRSSNRTATNRTETPGIVPSLRQLAKGV